MCLIWYLRYQLKEEAVIQTKAETIGVAALFVTIWFVAVSDILVFEGEGSFESGAKALICNS